MAISWVCYSPIVYWVCPSGPRKLLKAGIISPRSNYREWSSPIPVPVLPSSRVKNTQRLTKLVGGFNPSEKYESQLG